MTQLDLLGVGFFVLLLLAFYFLRSIPLYNAVSILILGGFVAVSWKHLNIDATRWILFFIALILDWFGLLTVRIMLTRSVSLQLLSTFSAGSQPETIRDELAGRLQDARTFHLVQLKDNTYALSLFGRFISAIVATFYLLLRIDR